MEDIRDPIEKFKDNVDRLKQMRDLIQNKMVMDFSRLVGLKTLLSAVGEARVADLDKGKMSVNWWIDSRERDMENIVKKVKVVSMTILKCWNIVIDNKREQPNQTIEVNTASIAERPFKEKINEVEAVLMSIRRMRWRMQGAVQLLREALEEVERPDRLLQLGLHRVTQCGLSLEELPTTLR